MSYYGLVLTTFISLISWELKTIDSQAYADFNYHPAIRQYTRDIIIKQGVLQGIVVEPRVNRDLPPVEQYRGIPYAAPPVGELRFMPSGSAPSWFGTKYADTFGPVCPQHFPNPRSMAPERRQQFMRLKEYLQNQSEDCLYLNIYAPYQDSGSSTRRYPVIVFIHGESFEWNSGNPYDGSVLASYGKVIVVTLNYRLGILGFLKAGTEEHSPANFGLVDQIAALLWVKENIAAFGGDPGSVTLLGHGTGAACVSFLMLSPMVLQEGDVLFQRAILMGGTALADWALAGNPREVTYQVAQALNCQIHDDFAACLRRKRLDEIMSAATVLTLPYRSRFGPVVDSRVVPNDPKKSMTTYSDIFRRFELMYGLTELESIHLLGPVPLTHGMLDKERDQELKSYLRTRCENTLELCVARTLAEYTDITLNDQDYMNHQPDKASMARDVLLDILSDARTAAPMVQMARYHAALNLQSYFYVFAHKTNSKEFIRNKTFTGEDLAYVFGVPLDGQKFHFIDRYTDQERLLSEIMMTYFSNFAYTGNPNVPGKNDFLTLGPITWKKYNIEWPEFETKKERYLQLDTPPHVGVHHRSKEMIYWNEILTELANANDTYNSNLFFRPTSLPKKPKNRPPYILTHPIGRPDLSLGIVRPRPTNNLIIGTVVKESEKAPPDNLVDKNIYGTVLAGPPDENKNATMNIIIIVGVIFLIANLILFAGLYYKCYRIKKSKNVTEKNDEATDVVDDFPGKLPDLDKAFIASDCNIMKMLSKSSKSDDTYEAVKGNSSHSKQSKHKLTRQMSNSTIDAHTKVREWIAQEIVHKYSPRYFRRPRPQPPVITGQLPSDLNSYPENPIENDSTLGRSPTRPVSPIDDTVKDNTNENNRPPLIKQLSASSLKKGKKPEKVSVAVDATPAGRGPSVLKQVPIELSRSLDYPNYTVDPPLRRSVTLEDFSCKKIESKQDVTRSTTNISLKPPQAGEVIKIQHSHSRSEPVQEIYSQAKKLKTFDPKADVNVTSRDENIRTTALTPEEALMTIKRRNFPKVLPDLPSKEALAHKRRSMPTNSHFIKPIPEAPFTSQASASANKSLNKLPPAPPPRTTSTLGRKPALSPSGLPYCQSEPMLAEEPPALPEPEITYNNLYVGPLIPKGFPKKGSSFDEKLDTSPVYESLRAVRQPEDKILEATSPMAIVTADPSQLVKKSEPKFIIKPTMTRNLSDPKKNIARVVASDNLPQTHEIKKEINEKTETLQKEDETDKTKPKSLASSAIPVRTNSFKMKPTAQIKSQIPTLVKASATSLNKESSSSESTSPSEESDTGTVVKKV